ncbi:MAG: hypothetical protein BGO31_10950 [Bacteroidetes bacterium 43-16]|uniref:hypothetical protein n=1 Tax=uncultured Dysgonomonas sp. TaxID=206096 RepID=UPI00092B6BDD|nr:hypothetical protein [uncultured Dysgonomonas sp.]OJV50977.1 MAG: hypothetical protein BGO31_10950 [Bacteroidetes bacterium 43-16]
MEQLNKWARYKTETLLKKLAVYDNKYYEAIRKPRREQTWGYAMHAYHASKVANPPEWKIRDKAIVLVEELKKRGVPYSTIYLKI